MFSADFTMSIAHPCHLNSKHLCLDREPISFRAMLIMLTNHHVAQRRVHVEGACATLF